jgi:hypothetical protein
MHNTKGVYIMESAGEKSLRDGQFIHGGWDRYHHGVVEIIRRFFLFRASGVFDLSSMLCIVTLYSLSLFSLITYKMCETLEIWKY